MDTSSSGINCVQWNNGNFEGTPSVNNGPLPSYPTFYVHDNVINPICTADAIDLYDFSQWTTGPWNP